MIPRSVPLYSLAWAAALLPFIATHTSYLLAAGMGHVEWCVPYWDSCTSISATGRLMPEKLWFRASMIPAALVTLLFWWQSARWRRDAGPCRFPLSLKLMPWLGSIAAVCLILYTLALGEEGETSRFIRRIGVVLAFAFTYLAQLLLTRLLGDLARVRQSKSLQRWHYILFALSMILLAAGMLSVVLDAWLGLDYDRYEDAFEWNLALLLNLYFAGFAWCSRQISREVGIKNPAN